MSFLAQQAANTMPEMVHRGSFWLPEAASTFTKSHDALFYTILWLCVVFFIGIVSTMAYFAYRYRRLSARQKTSPIRGSHKLEIAWSAIPGVILVGIFVWGFVGFMDMTVPPANTTDIRVTGQKWSWSFQYPNGGVDSRLVVPVGEPIKLTMSSVDVLHSFYVPAFRVKRDVIPNRYTVIWFQSDVPGTYPVFCTEYCGTEHSQMITTVEVVTHDAYLAYLQDLGGCAEGETIEECGEGVYRRFACNTCHSVDGGSGIGPTFQGLYESTRNFEDGTSEVASEDYLRTSIVNPGIQVVEGYQNVMPGNYGQQMTEEQIGAVIAYIKSLN
jgi:cytochrome c oxidase subunit 2